LGPKRLKYKWNRMNALSRFFLRGGSDFGICYLLIVGSVTVANDDTQRYTRTHSVDSSRRGNDPWSRPLSDNYQHSEQILLEITNRYNCMQ